MRLFVDTGAWFALNCRTDENHPPAVKFVRRFTREPVIFHTTDYVVDETVTLLRFKVSHAQAVKFLDFLVESPRISKEVVTPELLEEAERVFRRYRDKRWSYTDCVSLVFMDRRGLEDAFAFDRNFSQYGKRLYP